MMSDQDKQKNIVIEFASFLISPAVSLQLILFFSYPTY